MMPDHIGAKDTGFGGGIQCRTRAAAGLLQGIHNGKHFCVARYIPELPALFEGLAYNTAVQNDDTTNGTFACSQASAASSRQHCI